LALALESLPETRRIELLGLIGNEAVADAERVGQVKYLYELSGVFEKAQRLVDKFRAKAEDLADTAEPEPLRCLLQYLVDSVLDGTSHVVPEKELGAGLLSLPVA